MFPPALIGDERVILRGGFGGNAWIYTGIVAAGLAMTIVLVPLAAYFWLRSCRFVLTDRRLVVKPTVGRARERTLDELRGASITIGTATGTVFVDGPVRLRLRYQRGCEKAWGALLVLCHWTLPSPAAAVGPGYQLGANAVRRNPRMTQGGLCVLSGDQLAFLPINSGLPAGGIGKTAALAAIGVREVRTRAEFPVDELVQVLRVRGGDFGAHVATLAHLLDGLVWSLPQTQRQRTRSGLIASVGDEQLDIRTLDDALTDRLLAG